MFRKSIFFALLSISFLINFSQSIQKSLATSFTPESKIISGSPLDLYLEKFQYKNETKQKETVVFTIKSYDQKNDTVLETKPFITIKQSKFTVNPNAKLTFDYAILIPSDTQNGTYYNKVYMHKIVNKQSTTPVLVSTFTFNVVNYDTTIEKLFYDQSDVNLVLKQKGLPFISETVFEYTYTNNSNYVFIPSGQIQIQNAQDESIFLSFNINQDQKIVYPGQSITKEYSFSTWKDLTSIIAGKTVVSLTGNDITENKIENHLGISILYQMILISGVLGIITVAIVITLISLIVKSIKSKKKK